MWGEARQTPKPAALHLWALLLILSLMCDIKTNFSIYKIILAAGNDVTQQPSSLLQGERLLPLLKTKRRAISLLQLSIF